ncbi:MAG TPA: hypothetical protein VHC63_17325 [Acidimicrobiales bacterium]|nr:hypothetical protein [Acidimicrobiales bacterium]
MKRLLSLAALLLLLVVGASPAHAVREPAVQLHAQHVAQWGCGVTEGYC